MNRQERGLQTWKLNCPIEELNYQGEGDDPDHEVEDIEQAFLKLLKENPEREFTITTEEDDSIVIEFGYQYDLDKCDILQVTIHYDDDMTFDQFQAETHGY